MKFGVRKPSIKKSISAHTTGKAKRKLKRLVNPFYGKKGMGWIRNPKKALYNKVYRKTTISAKSGVGALLYLPFTFVKLIILVSFYLVAFAFVALYWAIVLLINGGIALAESIINLTAADGEESELQSALPPVDE